jgi:hypothetical protein
MAQGSDEAHRPRRPGGPEAPGRKALRDRVIHSIMKGERPVFAEDGHDRSVSIAAVVVAASVVGSVIVSRHVGQRLLFSRVALIGVGAELAILAILERRRVWQELRSFFTAETHALNLAVFRMAVFWAIFQDVQLPAALSFARMPSGLQFAPWGMSRILPHLPIDPKGATLAGALLLVFSATGFLGLFSRSSALACALLGFYFLGIPSFYGKVDHNHHLLWFAAILAVSPCGDALSLDAIVAARRRADRGIPDPPALSRAYALPLRFVMLLTGVIYFFPGFWKLWQSGFDWFLTDNLSRQLHLFWTWSFGGLWLPAFRIDRHALLCRSAAAATILFEVALVFLVFSRRLRAVPAVAGIAFHAATYQFMRIGFLSLCVCYVAFFDWASIRTRVARAIKHPAEAPKRLPDEASPSAAGRHPSASIAVVGCALLVGAIWGGAARRINGWPFACYPAFSEPPPEQTASLAVVAVFPSGAERAITDFGLSRHRLYGLGRNILAIEDPAARDGRLLALWKRAVETSPDRRTATVVKFYAESLWIDPDRWSRNPRSRSLLFAWRPSPDGSIPEPRTKARFTNTEWQ